MHADARRRLCARHGPPAGGDTQGLLCVGTGAADGGARVSLCCWSPAARGAPIEGGTRRTGSESRRSPRASRITPGGRLWRSRQGTTPEPIHRGGSVSVSYCVVPPTARTIQTANVAQLGQGSPSRGQIHRQGCGQSWINRADSDRLWEVSPVFLCATQTSALDVDSLLLNSSYILIHTLDRAHCLNV